MERRQIFGLADVQPHVQPPTTAHHQAAPGHAPPIVRRLQSPRRRCARKKNASHAFRNCALETLKKGICLCKERSCLIFGSLSFAANLPEFTTIVHPDSIGSRTCRRQRQRFRKLGCGAQNTCCRFPVASSCVITAYTPSWMLGGVGCSSCLLVISTDCSLRGAGARHIFACKHTSRVGPFG